MNASSLPQAAEQGQTQSPQEAGDQETRQGISEIFVTFCPMCGEQWLFRKVHQTSQETPTFFEYKMERPECTCPLYQPPF